MQYFPFDVYKIKKIKRGRGCFALAFCNNTLDFRKITGQIEGEKQELNEA